jgi:hypothetical protein
MSAYLEGQNTVTPRHVKYAMDHLDGSEREGPGRKRTVAFYALIIGAAFALTLLIGYQLMSSSGDGARADHGGAPREVSDEAGPAHPEAQPPVHAERKSKK